MRHGRGRPLGAVKPSWEGNRDVHGGASRRRPATEIASQVWACLFGPYLSPYLSLSSPNLCFYLCRLQGVGVSCHATNRGHRTHHDGRQCSEVGPAGGERDSRGGPDPAHLPASETRILDVTTQRRGRPWSLRRSSARADALQPARCRPGRRLRFCYLAAVYKLVGGFLTRKLQRCRRGCANRA